MHEDGEACAAADGRHGRTAAAGALLGLFLGTANGSGPMGLAIGAALGAALALALPALNNEKLARWLVLALLVAAGFVAGFIDSIAGGGGLIGVPVLPMPLAATGVVPSEAPSCVLVVDPGLNRWPPAEPVWAALTAGTNLLLNLVHDVAAN